jgi:hypothetical protein
MIPRPTHPAVPSVLAVLSLRRSRGSLVTFERLEPRTLRSATGYESLDGTGNNAAHPTWGATGTDLIRLTAAAYGDGISTPALSGDLSARQISNLINSQTDPADPTSELNITDGNNLSDFGYAFGQFMDHDMDLTLDGGSSLPITTTADDPIGTLPFTRSQYDPATGTSTSNPRQQTTDVTAYLDLSQVYGSDAATAAALRTFSGGLLKTSPGNMLPYLNSTYFTAAQLAAFNSVAGGMQDESGVPTTALFATGDVRGDENLELTALETLFVRNHNLLASKLQKEHPQWTDEQLYQEARKLNIAGYQSMIYNQYLPALLGANAVSKYTGYKPNVDPAISNEFSTVAFRMGHSMVSPSIARDGNDGSAVAAEVPLSDDFFDPYLLNPTGATDPYTGLAATDIGPVLKGEADGNGQAMDTMVVNEIRNLLFGNGAGGDDLIARDIQRGRDNGIGTYNQLRTQLGLPAVTSFAQITPDTTVQAELAAAYPGGVNTIDAFEGGLAETHVPGSDVGPLFQRILVDQFTRLRDGDRFYFQNESLNADELALLGTTDTLTKVIEANTAVTHLQPNAFVFTVSITGTVTAPGPTPPGGRPPPPPVGVAGVTVDLLDDTGAVVATATTDAAGHYAFTQQAGLTTGAYTVSITARGSAAAQASAAIKVTTGGQTFADVNFTTTATRPAPPPPAAVPQSLAAADVVTSALDRKR